MTNSPSPRQAAASTHPWYTIPAVAAAILIGGIIFHYFGQMFLLIIAALFLANIFRPLITALETKKIPTALSLIAVLVIVALILTGVVLIVQQAVLSVAEVAPKYQAKWEQSFRPALIATASNLSPELGQTVASFKIESVLKSEQVLNAMVSMTGVFSDAALILLFILFILASPGRFTAKIGSAFPSHLARDLEYALSQIDVRVRKYLVNTLLLNLLAAITMIIVLSLFGVDLALLWGILTFLLMFIPSIGSIFAAGIPIIVAFLQFDSLGMPLAVAVAVIVTQLLIGSVLTPKIMGSTLNLSPLLILLSIIFWGWVWGPAGMFFGVPITATLFVVFESIPALRPLAVLMSVEPKNVRKRAVRESKP